MSYRPDAGTATQPCRAARRSCPVHVVPPRTPACGRTARGTDVAPGRLNYFSESHYRLNSVRPSDWYRSHCSDLGIVESRHRSFGSQ
jgi:hypothetical protein